MFARAGRSALPTTLSSPLIPDLTCWVTVAGQPVPVYSTKVEGSKVTCYIEAQEGVQFEVAYRDARRGAPDDSYSARVYLDGRFARGGHTRKESSLFSKREDHPRRMSTFSAARITSTTERPFLFGTLLTTDDDDRACQDERVAHNLGTIQLRIQRITDLRPAPEPRKARNLEDIVIHEQYKKAQLSHQTTLGATQAAEDRRRSTYTSIDSTDNPFVTFEFAYRSRALLELGGHISAASDSVPRPGPRPPQAPKAALVTPPASLQKAKKSKKRPMEEITLDSSEDEEDGVDEVERLRARVAQLEREQALLKGGGKVKKAKLSGQVKAKEEKKGQAGRGAKERRVVIEVD